MPDQILVTGGSGLLGRLVVQRLLEAGGEVRAMSRRQRPADHNSRCEWVAGDLRSGEGVPEAVAGVGVIVHCATAFGRDGKVHAEIRLARTLIEAARRAGSPHLVYISIVGIDRVPLGYYQGKLATERLVQQSGLPYTILRLPGKTFRAYRAGGNLAPDNAVGKVTFEQYLSTCADVRNRSYRE